MKNNSSSGGVSLSTVVFIVFLILKLCNVIDWSWWWVTSPLWIGLGFWLLYLAGVLIYFVIEDHMTINYLKKPRKEKSNGKKRFFK